MAVYVARGLFAVAGLYFANEIMRLRISTSELSNPAVIVSEGTVQAFVAEQAKKLGLKQLIVIRGSGIFPYGNSLFGKMGVSISSDLYPPSEYTQFTITHALAHLQSNDGLYARLIPLITSIFTVVTLYHIAPVAAAVAGVAVGFISFALFWRWREKAADLTAMEHCSKEVNESYLRFLKEKQTRKSQESWFSLKKIWTFIIEPSTYQRIQYFQAFIDKQEK